VAKEVADGLDHHNVGDHPSFYGIQVSSSLLHRVGLFAEAFDPFFPALYLNLSRASVLNSLPLDWSAFATNSMRHAGIVGFFLNVGKIVWEGIRGWKIDPWEGWGNAAVGQPVPLAWPS